MVIRWEAALLLKSGEAGPRDIDNVVVVVVVGKEEDVVCRGFF